MSTEVLNRVWDCDGEAKGTHAGRMRRRANHRFVSHACHRSPVDHSHHDNTEVHRPLVSVQCSVFKAKHSREQSSHHDLSRKRLNQQERGITHAALGLVCPRCHAQRRLEAVSGSGRSRVAIVVYPDNNMERPPLRCSRGAQTLRLFTDGSDEFHS